MATLKEQFNQSPTIEACNSDIINLVTQMEQLKMTLKQADDEFNSLEQQQVSGESIETLENVKALESKIKQTELENNELANNMTKLQMDNAAAEDAQEKLKQLKNQLAMQVRYSLMPCIYFYESKMILDLPNHFGRVQFVLVGYNSFWSGPNHKS